MVRIKKRFLTNCEELQKDHPFEVPLSRISVKELLKAMKL